MSYSHAAGRKTENPAPRHAPGGTLEHLVETQLAALTDGLTAAFARAAAVEARADEFGHVRSNHISDAVGIAKSSAALLRAVAKVRGGKFDHNIKVTRLMAPAAEEHEPWEETDDGLTKAERLRIEARRLERMASYRQRLADEAAPGGPPAKI